MRPELQARHGKAGATAYSVAGAGEAVVLVHGVGLARAIWGPQAEELARDYRVVCVDLPGHGGSDVPPADVTLADYARALLAVLDDLGIAAANVVGHSMGALVALEFALRHPQRTLRVAALNAVFRRTPEQRAAVLARAEALARGGVGSTVDATLERWFGDPVPAPLQPAADLTGRLLRQVDATGYARTYRLFATSDQMHAAGLPALAMPALFFTGEHDLNSSPAMARAMAELAPRGRAEVLADARHMMNVTHPRQVTASLRAFLAGQPA